MTEVPTFNNVEEITSDQDSYIDTQIPELKHDFYNSLTDNPEILKYIERLHKIIRKQQKKLNKFYKKLKDYRFVKKCESREKESQTEKFDKLQSSDSYENAWNSLACIGEQNIVDEVKEIAENALKHTSFVYEPTSGMYYDYSTGYYYNAELRMYYDGNSGQYLEYDEETKTYKYHLATTHEKIKATTHCTIDAKQKKLKKRWDKHKIKRTKKSKLDETEEGEITESSFGTSETSSSDEETCLISHNQEAAFGCEPCIRIMVEETNVEKLKVGSLFVITCKGGTMGREGDHAVLIPDINVSKHHAKFVFNPETSLYYITDLGSRNGTWLDGERLSAALQESETFEINHGAVIQIGSTKLMCHIHIGRDTCSSCEPGLIIRPNTSTLDCGSKNFEYREQLLNLKKKFGVDGVSQDVYNIPGYEDRAEMRRLSVGSSHSSEKTQAASISECIPKYNKGFKMLSKMGWTEGCTLGKTDGGLAEPMLIFSNTGKHGLGMISIDKSNSVSKLVKKKQEILKKTQKRYKNIEGTPDVEDDETVRTCGNNNLEGKKLIF